MSGGLVTGTYAYDANGNATTDGRTKATLTYNFLNLPTTVSDENMGYSLIYTYDATGKKLRKNNAPLEIITDYIDGIQYNSDLYSSAIDFIQNEEGQAKNNGSEVYSYQCNLKDHL